jgi:hypothetical protein
MIELRRIELMAGQIFLEHLEKSVLVRFYGKQEDGTRAEFAQELRPGNSLGSKTYEEVRKMGPGAYGPKVFDMED